MKKRTDARPSLPTAAALAVNDGRLIEAIKIVRETDRLDLTAAKARVDAYIAANFLGCQKCHFRDKCTYYEYMIFHIYLLIKRFSYDLAILFCYILILNPNLKP